MNDHPPLFFLFPYTTLGEVDCVPLSLLFPSLNVLRIARPLEAPSHCRHITREWPGLDREWLVSEVSMRLRNYQEFASLHGEAGLQSSMAQQWALKNRDEDRHQIQSSVKAESPDKKSGEQLARMTEAALFLELARDLDEKEMDLEGDFHELGLLEDNFRKVLGMNEDDGLEEMAEPLELSLHKEKPHLSYALPQRISFWCRLVLPKLGKGQPALVTGEREVVDTMADAVHGVCTQKGLPFEPQELTLAPFPLDLSQDGRDFELLHWARSLSEAKEFWKAMEAMARIPPGRDFQDEAGPLLEQAWLTLKDRWGSRVPQKVTHALKVSTIRLTGCSMADLWNFWDRHGFQSLGGAGSIGAFQPLFFLYDLEAY